MKQTTTKPKCANGSAAKPDAPCVIPGSGGVSLIVESCLGEGGRAEHRTLSPTGFTLIELLVVIAVIALLAGLIFPVLSSVRERSRKTSCLNNLRQLGQVVNSYVLTTGGHLPECMRIGEGPDDPFNAPNTIGPDIKPIFHCPGDIVEKYEGKTYFARYGTSYEWNAWLNGRLIDKSEIGVQQMRIWSPLLGDADFFHKDKIKNYVWADGRVEESNDPLIIQQ